MDGVETNQLKQRRAKTELESKTFNDGQIYLFRRADYKKPTWFCRVKIPGAKGYVTLSTKTTDEHTAFTFATSVYNKSLVKILSGQELRGKRVSVALTEYTSVLSLTLKQKLSTKYRIAYLNRIVPFFGPLELNSLTSSTLVDLFDWMKENTKKKIISHNTIRRYSVDLKQFFIWCVDKGYIEKAPKFPQLRTDPNRRPHFDEKSYKKLIRHLQEIIKIKNKKILRDRIMLANYVLILSNTGIRVGEARTLKWKDLREIPSEKGSNGPPNLALFVSGKTGAREVVARTPDVKDYFKRILELRIKELKKPPNPDSFVFCNPKGTPIGSFKKSFASLLKGAGVEFDADGTRHTIYSLRHTYATYRLSEGVHQFILAKNMGTSTAMLEKHYGHTSNIASAAELTKSGNYSVNKKTKGIDWLMDGGNET
jgi:integrase